MHIALIANGSIQNYSQIQKKLKDCQKIIAVDGGLRHCMAMQLTPCLILGDFDSCTSTLLEKYAHIPQKQFPRNKDLSDLELALQEALSMTASRITAFGCVHGERTDHSLSNLLLLTRYPDILSFVNEDEHLFMIPSSISIPVRKEQTLSLIPLNGPVHDVSSQGLFWELNHHTLDHKFLSLSNRATGNTVKIERGSSVGDLLCILQDA